MAGYSSNISPFQLYKPRNIDGLLESNKLTNAFLTKPVEMAGVLAYAFGTDSRSGRDGNIMNLLTEGLGHMADVSLDNNTYRWKLYTGNQRLIEISGQISGGATPGIGGSSFDLGFSENFFEDGDNILLDDNKTVIRQEGHSRASDGLGCIATFSLVNRDPSASVSPLLLIAGARASREYNTQPEFSTRGSGISLHTGIELENRLGIFRKSLAITRSAQTDVMAMKIPMYKDGAAKPELVDVWDTAANWQLTYEMGEEIDRAMIYATRQDGAKKGANGRPIFVGAGFREQISPNNVWETSRLTYNYIDEMFTNLSYNATKNGGNKKFVVLTGQQGMKEVHRALKTEYGTIPFLFTDSNKFLGGDGDELELKGHFSKVRLMNGIEVSWKLFPEYDNRERNRKLDPQTGYPLESFRQTIMNVGTMADGKGNVQKVVKKDSGMVAWQVGGSTTASGTRKGNAEGASGLDGREVHLLSECGLRLADPTSCAEIIRVAN